MKRENRVRRGEGLGGRNEEGGRVLEGGRAIMLKERRSGVCRKEETFGLKRHQLLANLFTWSMLFQTHTG